MTVTITATNTAAGYDSESLIDGNLNPLWLADSKTLSNVFEIDLGSAQECDSFFIPRHNWDGSTITIESSSDDISYDIVCEETLVDNYIHGCLFDAETKRYWKITRTGSLAVFPYAGEFWLGKSSPLTRKLHNFDPNEAYSDIEAQEMESGIESFRELSTHREANIDILVDNTIRNELKSMIEAVGVKENIVFSLTPESGSGGFWGALYGYIKEERPDLPMLITDTTSIVRFGVREAK